jgi:hypothetical protein
LWRGEIGRTGRSGLFTFDVPQLLKTQRLTPGIVARLRGPLHAVVSIDAIKVPIGETAWILHSEPEVGGPALVVEVDRTAGDEWIHPIYRIDGTGEVWVTIATEGGIHEIPTQERDRKYLRREDLVLGLIAPEENWANVSDEHLQDLFLMLSKREVGEYGSLFSDSVIERAFIERGELTCWAAAEYPTRGAESGKKKGRPPKWQWDNIRSEADAWIVEYGIPEPQCQLERYLLQWCNVQWGDHPVESEIRRCASAAIAAAKYRLILL